MKLLIGIPVYISDPLHLDFTYQTLVSIKTSYEHETIVIGNYVAPELLAETRALLPYVVNPKGNCLAASWNLAIEEGIKTGADYILLVNNDIVFHKQAIDNLVAFAQAHPDALIWTAADHPDLRTLGQAELSDNFDEHPHFSCFMVSPQGLAKLAELEKDTGELFPGRFDEHIVPAYFEDNDMHQRILRQGLKALKTASARFYHYGSRTIKVDEELDRHNQVTYEKNREYFKTKWGFDPHSTAIANDDPIRLQFKKPFQK